MVHGAPTVAAESVLVVGAGFIGRRLLHRLSASDRPARALTRQRDDEIEALAPAGLVVGDAADPEACRRAVDGCGTVVWCAGELLPASTAADLAHTDDLTPVVTMLREASPSGARFIFLSSGGTVYGRPERLPVREVDVLAPVNVYGASKVLAERWIERFRMRSGLEANVLRCANVYGPGQQVRPTQGVVARALECALGSRPFPMIGDPESVRDYVFVDDVLDVVEACIDGRVSPPVVNVGSGHGTTLQDLLKRVTAVAGDLEIVPLPGRAMDIDRIALDISVLRQSLGDFEPTPLTLGLEETWRVWCRARL